MTLYSYDNFVFDVDGEGHLNSIKVLKTPPRAYDTIRCAFLAVSGSDKTYVLNDALHLDAFGIMCFWCALVDDYRMKHKGRDPRHGAGHIMQTIFRGSHNTMFNAGLMIISGMEGCNLEEKAFIQLAFAKNPEGWLKLRAQFYAAQNGLPKPS